MAIALKFVRLDENSLVLESYQVSGASPGKVRTKFDQLITKKYHADYADYFITVANNHRPKPGQFWNGSTFEDYVPSDEETDQKVKRAARKELKRLDELLLDELAEYIINLPDCPASIPILIDLINTEKGKL